MITGYNTDVRHNDVVFHVQTEDKGEKNPYIESLVYVGGQVLASRRASYTDLLASGEGDKAVLARMEKQHRAMIAAIRRGKLDGRLGEILGPSAAPGGSIEHTRHGGVPGVDGGNGSQVQPPAASASTPGAVPVPVPLPPPPAPAPQAAFDEDGDRTLDQVILDYLSSEAEQEQLILMIDGDPALRLGAPAAVKLRAASSKSGAPVSGAEVAVRMISTVSEPRTLTTGNTDANGEMVLRFEVPELGRGTAAIIISAACELGRAELKQLL